MKLRDYIKQNEGLRLKPYRCSAGKISIGWGRNLEDKGISIPEAEILLGHDISNATDDCYKIFGLSFNDMPYTVRMPLIDMMFNLGYNRFKRFVKMIEAVKDFDFNEAAAEILDSVYATQVPERAKRNAELVRNGEIPDTINNRSD